MKIAVSACLFGVNCKYNGGNNLDQELVDSLEGADVVLVCPELAGGLPCPHPPIELQGDRVLDSSGRDVTESVQRGVALCVEKIRGCAVAVLQHRSPTCGVHQVYDGTFSGRLIPGSGLFARAAQEKGVLCLEPGDAALQALLEADLR